LQLQIEGAERCWNKTCGTRKTAESLTFVLHGNLGQAIVDRKLGRRFAFSTLVWKIQLRTEVHEPIDASALGLLQLLRQGQPELKPSDAWQSGHALHRREELHALCDCVGRAAASVLQFLKVGEPAIEITGCWMNLMRRAPRTARTATPTIS
jgi:hypothetical protein